MEQIMSIIEKTQAIWLVFKNELSGNGELNPSGGFVENLIKNLKNPDYVVNLIINILILLMVVYALFIIYQNVKDVKRIKSLSEDKSLKKKGVLITDKVPLFKRLKMTVTKRFVQKKWNLEKVELLVSIVLVIAVALMLGFIFVKQYALAIAGPIIFIKFITVLFESLELETVDYLHAQLPQGIDSIQKVASRYNDLKNIFFEAAVTLPQPIRGEFEDLGRKMNSGSADDALEEFRGRFDDVWVSSFIFVVMSMTDTTEKSIALNNLTNLREMLDKENKLKQTAITDKKLSVNTNYTLAGMGAVAGLVACFVDSAREFYFSTPVGLLCFIGGYTLIGITIKVNLKMSVLKNQ